MLYSNSELSNCINSLTVFYSDTDIISSSLHFDKTTNNKELHWLPVRQRVRFKLACIMYMSLSGQAPQYLVDDVQLLADSGRRLLWSANYRACVVPQTQNSFGDKAFAVAGPKIWNNLLPELRHVDISFRQFRNMLKSYLLRF